MSRALVRGRDPVIMVGRSLGLLLMACVASACGGAAAGPGPETGGESEPVGPEATESPSSSEGASSEEATPSAPGDEASDPSSGGGSEAAATALEGDDLAAVLQVVLKDPELIDHLHINKPGRAPLKVAGASLPTKLKVVVGAHDVKVVDEPKSKKDPVLVFTKLEREGDQARIHYRFDVEGLTGRATVYLKKGRWELGANRVIEK